MSGGTRKAVPHYAAETAEPVGARGPQVGTIEFSMPGLSVDYEGRATLSDVPFLDIDYAAHAKELAAAGVDPRLAEEAVEAMAEFVNARTLAAHFAARMKDVARRS